MKACLSLVVWVSVLKLSGYCRIEQMSIPFQESGSQISHCWREKLQIQRKGRLEWSWDVGLRLEVSVWTLVFIHRAHTCRFARVLMVLVNSTEWTRKHRPPGAMGGPSTLLCTPTITVLLWLLSSLHYWTSLGSCVISAWRTPLCILFSPSPLGTHSVFDLSDSVFILYQFLQEYFHWVFYSGLALFSRRTLKVSFLCLLGHIAFLKKSAVCLISFS